VKPKDSIPDCKLKCICFGPLDTVTEESSGAVERLIALNKYKCASKVSIAKTNEIEHSMRLSAAPSIGTSDDIILRESYVSFNTCMGENPDSRLNCIPSNQKSGSPSDQKVSGRPSDEQLINVREVLANTVSNYRKYKTDIYFQFITIVTIPYCVAAASIIYSHLGLQNIPSSYFVY